MKFTALGCVSTWIIVLAAAMGRSGGLAAADYLPMIHACTQLNHQYAIARDTGNPEAFGPIFTDDAVFEMQGQVYSGKAAILTRLDGSEARYFARLLVTTVAITPIDAQTARGVTYFTMFQAPKLAGNDPPISSFKTFMGEYHDHYAFDGKDCRLSRRETRPLFIGTAEEQ